MRGSYDGTCRRLTLRLVIAPLLAGASLLVSGCGVPAGPTGQADEGTPVDAAMKLNAYDVSLIGIDLRDAKKTYQGQDIARAEADGEFFVNPDRLEGWIEELDRAIGMDGAVPTVDPVARRFVEALRILTVRLQALESYYRMRANLADKLARGRREDPLVLADYDRALAALDPFRNAVTQAANTADAASLVRLRAEGRMVDYYNVEIARRARLLRVVADAPGLARDDARMARADAIVGEVTRLLDKARAVRAEATARAAKSPKPESMVDAAPDIRPDDNVVEATESMVGAFHACRRAGDAPDRDREREQERLVDAIAGVILATN
ncbi:MAG: DUF3829 domain-containing protein [Sphingomonas sp.]